MESAKTQRLGEIGLEVTEVECRLAELAPRFKSRDAEVFKQAVEEKKALRKKMNALNREYWQLVLGGSHEG